MITLLLRFSLINEPAHEKTYIQWDMRPAKTQISLRIRAVWSESSLITCAFYSLRAIQRGLNENPCHTWWMYGLIWVFAGYTGLIVGFVVCWLICYSCTVCLDLFALPPGAVGRLCSVIVALSLYYSSGIPYLPLHHENMPILTPLNPTFI